MLVCNFARIFELSDAPCDVLYVVPMLIRFGSVLALRWRARPASLQALYMDSSVADDSAPRESSGRLTTHVKVQNSDDLYANAAERRYAAIDTNGRYGQPNTDEPQLSSSPGYASLNNCAAPAMSVAEEV